jgi:Fe-Mn family superoxide dismutase
MIAAISAITALLENWRPGGGGDPQSHFASGWGWLVLQEKLEVTSLHDTPTRHVVHGTDPLLGTLDVWEHA